MALPNPDGAIRSLSTARTSMQLNDFERRVHRFENPVCVHCAFTPYRSGDGRVKVANASKISVHGGTNMTGANPAEACNPFDLVVYLTQAVPNGMLTQGNVILVLVLVLVLCVCGDFNRSFTRR